MSSDITGSSAISNPHVYCTSEVPFTLGAPTIISLEITSAGNPGDRAVIDSVELGLVNDATATDSDSQPDDPGASKPDDNLAYHWSASGERARKTQRKMVSKKLSSQQR